MFSRLDEGLTLNFMKVENGIVIHKQLEKRNSRVFLRLKRRPFLVVNENSAS